MFACKQVYRLTSFDYRKSRKRFTSTTSASIVKYSLLQYNNKRVTIWQQKSNNDYERVTRSQKMVYKTSTEASFICKEHYKGGDFGVCSIGMA